MFLHLSSNKSRRCIESVCSHGGHLWNREDILLSVDVISLVAKDKMNEESGLTWLHNEYITQGHTPGELSNMDNHSSDRGFASCFSSTYSLAIDVCLTNIEPKSSAWG